MKTTIVELITTTRALVPITHANSTSMRLVEVARQAYARAMKEMPFDVCIESVEHGRITNANPLDTLTVIQNILGEYHRIRPSMQWYNDNGHPISDGEVMVKAIGNVLRRMGYVMVAKDSEPEPHYFRPNALLGLILSDVAIQHRDIITAIANTVVDTHTILTAEAYFEQLEREREPADILLQEER